MKYFIFMVLIWTSGYSGAEQRFLTTPFSPEVSHTSTFTSVLKKIELQNKQYARIPILSTERFVGIVWGKTETGENKFWAAGMDSVGLILQSGFVLKRVGDVYRGEIALQELGAAEEPTVIQIEIDIDAHVLYYGSLYKK